MITVGLHRARTVGASSIFLLLWSRACERAPPSTMPRVQPEPNATRLHTARDNAPKESSLTNTISLTGQIVTKSQANQIWSQGNKPFTLLELMKYGRSMYMWMFIDDDVKGKREELLAEQNSIGLLSALMLTVTFSYFFALDGFDWDHIAIQWGSSNQSTVNMMYRGTGMSGENMARIHRDFLSIFSLVSTVFYILATVHSVLTIMMVSQLTGEVEPREFCEKMCVTNSSGIGFFLVGTLCLICFLLYHFFIFSWYVGTMIGTVVTLIVIVLVYVFGIIFRQQLALFEIKSNTYNSKPITLSLAELEKYVLQFCEAIGPDHCSAPGLTEFVRDRVTTARAEPNPEGDYTSASRVTFSVATQQTIELLASRVVAAYVHNTVESSTLTKEASAIGGLEKVIQARQKLIHEPHEHKELDDLDGP